MSLADNGTAFFGEKGPALVFDPQGRMFRGAIVDPTHFKLGAGGKLTPNYPNLTSLD